MYSGVGVVSVAVLCIRAGPPGGVGGPQPICLVAQGQAPLSFSTAVPNTSSSGQHCHLTSGFVTLFVSCP